MTELLILGAGRIGRSMAGLLGGSGDYRVTLADADPDSRRRAADDGLACMDLDARDGAALRRALRGRQAVVSTGPFHLNKGVAEAAFDARVDYFDVTEDVETARHIERLAANAPNLFAPQCGLAPGVISIVANDLARKLERVHDMRLRVGALPRYATGALAYNLTWSTEGLINEYINPCDAVIDGTRRTVPALEGLEEFTIEGTRFEAFNTSGGLGTLADSYDGAVRNLDYKTIRYPGHCAAMRLLLRELRLADRRDLLKQILEHAVPGTQQDMVVMFVTVTGMASGRLTQASFARMIEGRTIAGRPFSAIELTTASAAAAVVDMRYRNVLPRSGFLRQEQVPLDGFLTNRFGAAYA